MKKKASVISALLLASTFALIGCNNQDNNQSSTKEESSSVNVTPSSSSSSETPSSSKEESSSQESSLSSSDVIDDTLQEYKDACYSELDYLFNELDVEEYPTKSWEKIVEAFTKAKNDINNAKTKESVEKITNDCITLIRGVKTRRELLSTTPFQVASGSYDVDYDIDTNEVVVGYDEWPGNWTYVGNTDYKHEDNFDLKHDIETQNVYKMKVKNSGKNKMYVQLAMANEDESYKNSTEITILESGEEAELTLPLAQKVTYLYLFVNSCYVDKYYPVIEGAGELRIQSYGFDYVEQDAPVYSKGKVEVTPDKSVAIGEKYVYSLRKIKDVAQINKVRVTCRIDLSENSSSTYYGGSIEAGNTKLSISGNGYIRKVDTDKDNNDDYYIQTFVLETKDLNADSSISINFSYAGKSVTGVVIQDLLMYYNTGKEFVDETVDTSEYANSTIYDTTYHELVVPYSAFKNKGRVEKITLNLTIANDKTYTGGTMYCTGCGDFMDGNLANIGFIQKSGNTTSGNVTLYPTADFNLSDDEKQFTFTSWWSAASSVKVNSVTVTTEMVTVPSVPTDLVAHASNGGVALEWGSVDGATQYGVYVNGEEKATVSNPYYYVDNLTNETEYSFQVKSINSVGSSELTSVVKATPSASIEYDLTLDGLNTDLEKMIGKSDILAMRKASAVSKGNNYRFKNAVSKMRSGADTTIGFIGGSITVGEICEKKTDEGFQKGYASYTYDYIKDTFGTGNNVKYLNAGISGTGTEIGITRVDEDILSKSPDVIFIEYACNNSNTDLYKETFESMVRKCLNAPNHPAVILLFSATTYSGGKVEEYMTEIGNHYSLPMVSMDKALKAVCTKDGNGQLTTSDPIFKAFIKDGTHPNDQGHQLYGKMVASMLKSLANDEADAEYTLPTTTYLTNGDKYENMQMVNGESTSSVVKQTGSWDASDTETQCLRESHTTAFDHGWSKSKTDENNALVFETYSKNAILIYKNENPEISGNYGTINIVVTNIDTNEVVNNINQDLTISYRDGTSTGWHNPVAIDLYDFETCGNYRVSITMTSSDNGTGSIFAFGYSN